jgi:hypothetical protein
MLSGFVSASLETGLKIGSLHDRCPMIFRPGSAPHRALLPEERTGILCRKPDARETRSS